MTAITALNVRLGLDASLFSEGADMARAEVNKVASVLRQSEPPAKKFQKEMELLDRAFSESGKQTQEYANAVEFLRQKHKQVPEAIQPTRQELEFLAAAEKQAAEDNRFLASVIEKSTPAIQKYQHDLIRLNALYPASKRGSDEYARAVEYLKQKHGQVAPVVKQAENNIRQMTQSMLSAVPGGRMLGGAMTGVAGAALAAATAVAIASREIAKAAARIDETAKAARSLGIAYSDLVAIQMQAGEVAGLDPESVNRGLEKFVRRLAEARVNGGKLEETMRSVGLSVEDLAAMDPASSFKAVANAIAGVSDKAEQVRIATELVGREGAKMVELFRAGGAAMSEMNKEAERLGLALSDEAVASVESMNDAWGRSGKSAEGLWNQVAVALAPVLTDVAKLVEQLFVSFRDSANVAGGLADVFNVILWPIEKMVKGFTFIVAALGDIQKATRGDFSFEETNRLLDEMDASSNGIASATEAAAAHAEALAIETQRAADQAAKVQESFEKQVESLEIERLKLEGNVELARQMELAAQGYNEEQQKEIMLLEQQNEQIKERKKAEEEAAKEAEKRIEDAKKSAKQLWDTIAKGYQEAAKELEKIDAAFAMEVDDAMKAAEQYFEQQRQQDKKIQEEASKGPGAGMEVGSAAAAKFMADQMNAALGAAAMPEKPTPGEKEIADKTRELLLAQRAANEEQRRQSEVMRQQLAELKDNKVTRIR